MRMQMQKRRQMLVTALVLALLVALFIFYLLFGGPKLPPEALAIIDEVLEEELPELITGETGYATSDNLQIWYERLSPDGAAKGIVLMIVGTGGDGFMWPPKFIRTFLDAGYQVIRYDHRGTGMSDWVEKWSFRDPYSVIDLSHDALSVLDTLDVQKTHLVGLSMGGMIAQQLAIDHPDRVASLTLMMTSGDVGDPDLPEPSGSYFIKSAFQGFPLMKYRILGGEKNLIRERIAKEITFAGPDNLDVREAAQLVLYDLRRRRGINVRALFQHFLAVGVSPSRYEGLAKLDIPALVIHGVKDQLLPVEHGKKLAETIPNAEGIWIEDAGHIFPLPGMDDLQARIISHINASNTVQEETTA